MARPRIVGCLSLILSTCAGAALAAGSTATNPLVTFDSSGAKQIQLTSCNALGCTTVTKTVIVHVPQPVALSMMVDPQTVVQGDLVHLAATGQGAPPLTFRWRVVLGITQVDTIFGATGDWLTSGFAPGTYVVFLDVINSYGSHTPFPVIVEVGASLDLFSDGFETGLSRWRASP